MLRTQAAWLHRLAVLVDAAAAGIGFLLCIRLWGVPPSGWSTGHLAFAIVATLAWPVALDQIGLYRSQRRDDLARTAARLATVAVGVIALLFLTGAALRVATAPLFPLVCGAAQLLVLAGCRLTVIGVLRMARRNGRNTRSVVIVGSGPRALQVWNRIRENPRWGLRVVSFLDEVDAPVSPALEGAPLCKLPEFPELIQRDVVDEVILACPRSLIPATAPVVGACAEVGIPVTLLSDIFGDLLPAPHSTRFGSLSTLSFERVRHSPFELAVKRAIDVVAATLLLAAAAPLLLVSGLLVRLSSPGPALFRQIRSGRYGRPFVMLKLRTMVQNAEQMRERLLERNVMKSGPTFKVRNDPRVTSVGRVLRRLSIDELPQLWNVIRGDMSLVGPRPPLPSEVAEYELIHRRRLSMRPGITCWWQVRGRTEIPFEDWVKLDLEYIDHWSLATDFRILLLTIPAVLSRRGAD